MNMQWLDGEIANDWHQCFAVDQLGDIVFLTTRHRRRHDQGRNLGRLNRLKRLKTSTQQLLVQSERNDGGGLT